jgi:hypothetical protein
VWIATSIGYWPWVSSTSFCQSTLARCAVVRGASTQLASSSVNQRPLTFQPSPTSGQVITPPRSGLTVQ